MKEESSKIIGEKLDTVIELLQQLVALELSQRGATRQAIAKNLGVATAKVVRILSGVRKDDANV